VVPVTAAQFTVILLDDVDAVAVTPDGTAGMVVAEAYDDSELSPVLL